MPRIIVQAERVDGGPGVVTLTERSIPVEEHNDHYLAQLIERVSWALLDAEQLEQGARAVDTGRNVAADPVSTSTPPLSRRRTERRTRAASEAVRR
jgi:hypothetical protein